MKKYTGLSILYMFVCCVAILLLSSYPACARDKSGHSQNSQQSSSGDSRRHDSFQNRQPERGNQTGYQSRQPSNDGWRPQTNTQHGASDYPGHSMQYSSPQRSWARDGGSEHTDTNGTSYSSPSSNYSSDSLSRDQWQQTTGRDGSWNTHQNNRLDNSDRSASRTSQQRSGSANGNRNTQGGVDSRNDPYSPNYAPSQPTYNRYGVPSDRGQEAAGQDHGASAATSNSRSNAQTWSFGNNAAQQSSGTTTTTNRVSVPTTTKSTSLTTSRGASSPSSSQPSKYVQVQGAYFENNNGVLMAVSDPTTLRQLSSGQIRATSQASLDGTQTYATPAQSHRPSPQTNSSNYVNIQGAYFENKNGVLSAVSDATTLRGLLNGQIASTKQSSLGSAKIAVPPTPTQKTTPAVATSIAPTAKQSAASTSIQTGTNSALSDNDKRWLNTLPQQWQQYVQSLPSADIAAKKKAGTWEQYQVQIDNRIQTDARAQIKSQVVKDAVTGLPKAAKDVTTGCIQGTGQAVTSLGAFDNPLTAANTYTSALQRGDGQTAGKVLCKNVGAAAIAVAPIGDAAIATRTIEETSVSAVARSATRGFTLPTNRSQLLHIFKNAEGHLLDTSVNRKLLQSVANDSGSYLGPDAFGNAWSAKILEDGTQAWTKSRNGQIIDGGLNQTPRTYNSQTGLSASSIPGR